MQLKIIMSELKAAVGISREWNARKAGREVARKTIEKLGEDPQVVLLFCTIHYRDNGGIKNFLKGAREILPRKTKIIGGSITGFLTKEITCIRGACALGLSYDKMDVV